MNHTYVAYKSGPRGNNSRGRISKARSSRGGISSTSTRKRATAAPRKPYTPVEYPKEQCLYFGKADAWDRERLVKGVKQIQFGPDFDVREYVYSMKHFALPFLLTFSDLDSSHLDTIIAIGPAICDSLLDFRAGDSESGQGARLSDAGVARFAAACPNLIHVSLDGSTHLSDVSFLAIISKCPDLRYLQLSGNDKVTGNLKDAALNELGEKSEWGTKLVKLRLTDQDLNVKALKSLSAKRKKLAIEDGCTHERGGGVNTWLGGKMKFGYQAFGGPGGFNQYGGFGPFW